VEYKVLCVLYSFLTPSVPFILIKTSLTQEDLKCSSA
jgi:hypothetical protein